MVPPEMVMVGRPAMRETTLTTLCARVTVRAEDTASSQPSGPAGGQQWGSGAAATLQWATAVWAMVWCALFGCAVWGEMAPPVAMAGATALYADPLEDPALLFVSKPANVFHPTRPCAS